MISAKPRASALAERLADKARRLATARSPRGDAPRRWRSAGWLWPLFAKD